MEKCGVWDSCWRRCCFRAPARHRQAFSLDFCGNVISVDVPKGWVSRVEGNPDLTIDFQIRDEAQPFSIPPGKSLDGFVIRLSPGWRRRAASTARWDSGATGNVMTHDWCK